MKNKLGENFLQIFFLLFFLSFVGLVLFRFVFFLWVSYSLCQATYRPYVIKICASEVLWSKLRLKDCKRNMLKEKANFATFGRTQEDQKEHKLEKKF